MPAGQVSAQNPGGGSKVGKGSTVTLTVSTGKPQVTVPDVVGLRCRRGGRGARSWASTPRSSHLLGRSRDTVTGAAPGAGRQRPEGLERAHQRLARREADPSPRRDGSAVSECEVCARRPGLRRRGVDVQSDLRRGHRRRDDPPPGNSVSKGSKVTLSVSKGPATTQVPVVTGQNQARRSSGS